MRALPLLALLAAYAPATACIACSVFNHSGTDTLMVGRNLDWVSSSEGRIGFLHPTCDGHGAIYFYIDDHVWPQGGMNDQGLVLGMTATPYLEITGNPDGAAMGWDFWDDLFASCATVDDVLQYLAMFDLGSIEAYYEPTEREVTVYNRGDFDCGVTLNLAEELGNGGYELWMDELFDGDPCAEGDDDDDSAEGDDDDLADDDDSAPVQDGDDTVEGGAGGCGCDQARVTRSPAYAVPALVALMWLRRRIHR